MCELTYRQLVFEKKVGNAPGPDGSTPLQMAAIHGSTEIFKFLTCQKNESTKPHENH